MAEDGQESPDGIIRYAKRYALAMLLASLIIYFWSIYFMPNTPLTYQISYSQFMDQLNSNNIRSISLKKLQMRGELVKDTPLALSGSDKPQNVRYFETTLPSFQGEGLISQLRDKNVMITVESAEQGIFYQIVISILPWALLIGLWIFLMRRTQQQIQGGAGGLFTFGASKARLFDAKKPGITFDDVAGMDSVKKELRETIEYLKDPSRFSSIGAKVPKGVLLVGPPGTGKTLLARAVAGESGVPFFSMSASEFIEMFVGVGASRVRDLFKKAREAHPSIVFIDEIDAVGRTRGTGFGGGHDEREQTLNQLLSELDGFDPHTEVIVMAATNRPDVLDPALLRPGRFDRHIVIERPGWKERRAIIDIHIRGKSVAGDLDLDLIARGTPGMTGADLENLVNEAALVALRRNSGKITMKDLEEARDIILMGAIREMTISDEEKRITAFHEAGHALVARELPGTDPIYKVSVIPRGMAMGVTQLIPEEDRHYYPKTYLMNKLCVALGGRVAEKLVLGDLSSGAQNDLKDATMLAEKMVAQWGMSDRIGPINLGRGEEHPFLGRELSLPKRYSEEMAWVMDQEIQKLVLDAETRASDILREKRKALDALAEALIREEVLEQAEVESILKGSSSDLQQP